MIIFIISVSLWLKRQMVFLRVASDALINRRNVTENTKHRSFTEKNYFMHRTKQKLTE